MAIIASHPQFSDDYRLIEQADPLIGLREDIGERTHFAEVSNIVLWETVNGNADLIDVVRTRPVAKEFLPTHGRPYKEALLRQKSAAMVHKVPVGLDVPNHVRLRPWISAIHVFHFVSPANKQRRVNGIQVLAKRGDLIVVFPGNDISEK